ncbi:MAG: zinc-ribbon domain-containing protein [Clostridia bacterium]|nr:zinc-ribbon domain-containing protein [Clostridia bacterium]
MFCINCGTNIPDNAQFCSSCGYHISNQNLSPVSTTSNFISQPSYNEVKEYLSYAKKLETNRLALITTKNQLQNRINQLGFRKEFSAPKSDSFESFKIFFIIAFVIVLLIGFVVAAAVSNDGDIFANLLSIITIVLIFFNTELLINAGIALGCAVAAGLVVGIFTACISRSTYKQQCQKYKQAVDADNKRVINEQRQIGFLQTQQAEIDRKIAEIESVMSDFYSLNIIYPKYRNLIPIVTLYEYFESGRHTTLSDAYNKYEDELLHKTIIEKLDVVISRLEQIRQNQNALYEAILESNSIAERICQQSDTLIASNKMIEKNTALAAYHSKIAADNSAINAYINISRM